MVLIFLVALVGVYEVAVNAHSAQCADSLAALEARGIDFSNVDVDDNTSPASQCSVACQTLSSHYGSQVVFPNTTQYNYELSQYWSLQQSQTYPACIFRPSSADDVAVSVLLSETTKCPFAVKSGGHAAFKGASNIAGGITIDFADMNEITVSEDGSIVSIGPGNTWYDVYTTLELQNLTVIGGRVAAIGVGGLTLGGGISFFSGLQGWACDNVANYEVVTASGSIINANPTDNSDLHWALRGGGNNFGLVTRFDAYAYPQGPMWGGARIHSALQNVSLIQGLVDFGNSGSIEDPAGAVILSFAYVPSYGAYIADLSLEYDKPLPNGTHPAVFDEFFAIPNAISDSTTTQWQSNITLEFNASNPGGLRESYWTEAFKLDAGILSDILQIFVEETDNIKNVTGILPALTCQVITLPTLSHMSRNGGNCLGIENSTYPILLINPNVMWALESDDNAVLQAQSNIVARAKARSAELGLDNEYIYMNYASQFQDVISSYGAENKARLASIARKYDPDGVFQNLEPGYFKLYGSPEGS